MNTAYEIHPILTCKIKLDKGAFTYLRNYGEEVLVPVWVWLILGGEMPILVDAGCSLADFMRYAVLTKGGEEGIHIEDSLQAAGVAMSDIGAIVMTHLHSDHVLNARKFPNAKIVVQKKELGFASNPHPLCASFYNREWYRGLNFQLVDGDTEIFPGLEVVMTPGHTVGGQSVSVTMRQEKAVIAGFCSLDDNFRDEGDIVPGIHVDPLSSYDSIIKIRKKSAIIIPLHSQRALNVKSYS